MLSLHVHLLTGAYRAAHPTDRGAPEWPPHPARVHAALVDAVHASGEGDTDTLSLEVDAIEWLERQGPPVIRCDWRDDWPAGAPHRGLLTSRGSGCDLVGDVAFGLTEEARGTYVPLNDPDMKFEKGNALTVEGRRTLRKERHFPEVIPEHPHVAYGWPEADAPPHIDEALRAIARRVARIGHASSLVSVRWDHAPIEPTFVPHREGSLRLRVVEPGTHAAWRARHQAGIDGTPLPVRTVGYLQSEPTPEAPPSPLGFGPAWWVLRLEDGPVVDVTAAARLSRIVRAALLELGPQPPPAWWSGHATDGAPTTDPHLAVVPLPYVGSERADGRVLGVAIIPPAEPTSAYSAIRDALVSWRSRGFVLAGAGRRWTITVDASPDAATLDPVTWRRPSRRWASATPVLLDRHPGADVFGTGQKALKAHAEAAALIARACARAGLPAPQTVELTDHSPLRGVPPLGRDRTLRHGIHRRPLVHALLHFDAPVAGPVLLGAGRYLGLGLFRPLPDRPLRAPEPTE